MVVDSNTLEIVNTLKFDTGLYYTVSEIYLHGEKLVVIGNMRYEYSRKVIFPDTYNNMNMTRVIVYDISDRKDIKQIRELIVDGNYSKSRKTGTSLYLLTDKYISSYLSTGNGLQPCIYDSIKGDKYDIVGYDKIRYFPGNNEFRLMSIATLNLDSLTKEASVKSYIGSVNNIYMSTKNLYVTSLNYSYSLPPMPSGGIAIMFFRTGNTTNIYKFKLEENDVLYKGRSKVPGYILNQFNG